MENNDFYPVINLKKAKKKHITILQDIQISK